MASRSASQCSAYEDCKRKWAWDKIEKIPKGEPTRAQRFGTNLHKQIELYYQGTPLDLTTEEGQCALAGIDLLPPPSASVQVEQRFDLYLGQYHFLGYKDLTDTGIVYDHKTCSDFKWSKTSSDLRRDFQACLYAADALQSADNVDLQWTYFRTKRPYKAQRVNLRVYRGSTPLVETLARLEAIAQEMATIEALGWRAKDLPPNYASCEKYGGCEYKNICLTPEEQLRSLMSNNAPQNFTPEQMQLMARLQSQPSAINPPPPPPQGFAPPPPPPPPPVQQAPQYEHVSPDGRMGWNGRDWEVIQAAPPPVQAQPFPLPPPPPPPGPPQVQFPANGMTPHAPPGAPPPPPPPTPEAPKRGPGRPPKSQAAPPPTPPAPGMPAIMPSAPAPANNNAQIADLFEQLARAFRGQ